MADDFRYDVFLSHASQDTSLVREVAERLRGDGVRVWSDEWQVGPDDSIPTKIEEGLEHSRVLMLSMSARTFGSEWAQLESATFRFRDPLNMDRRSIPLRLNDEPNRDSLVPFLYINCFPQDRERQQAKVLENSHSN